MNPDPHERPAEQAQDGAAQPAAAHLFTALFAGAAPAGIVLAVETPLPSPR